MRGTLVGILEWRGTAGTEYESQPLNIEIGEVLSMAEMQAIIFSTIKVKSRARDYPRLAKWLKDAASTARFIPLAVFRGF